jgi:predicted site-specific integrase-resolvase
MTLDRFIPISEAAQRLHVSVKKTRALINSGKIKGGILPDGGMVVSEETLPKRKEDLPEYKMYAHLNHIGIGIAEAARKYKIAFSTLQQWVQRDYVGRVGQDKNKVLINEQDVAYCVRIYREAGAVPKRRLFNSDGTPYKPKNGS